MKKYIVYFLFIFLVSGCISEFNPEIESDNEYMIIDAKITDKDGATVRLSRIKGGETRSHMLETDAYVEIRDNDGVKNVLTKKAQGVYYSGVCGIPGKIYTLYINTGDGNEYISSPQELIPEAPIDSLYPAFDFQAGYNSATEKPGVAFYLDFDNSTTEWKYFRWTYHETWMQRTPYSWKAYGTWDKSGNLTGINFWPAGTEHNRKCFHYNSSTEVIIKNLDLVLSGSQKANPMFFTDDLSNRFSIGYSVEIRQYSITPDAFLYYKQLQKNNELTGSLYDPIPSFIESNIFNLNDQTENVTGFFVTAGVAKKRIFIHPADVIPSEYLSAPSSLMCPDSTAISYIAASSLHRTGSLDIYDYTAPSPAGPMQINMTNPACFDCTANGGSIQKPTYWDDRYSGN